MVDELKPVFYSESQRRWRAFQGAVRVVGAFFVLAVLVVGFTIVRQSGVVLPQLQNRNQVYRRILDPDRVTTFKTTSNVAFRRAIARFESYARMRGVRHMHRPHAAARVDSSTHVRAAFFVNWDARSYYSLVDNIDRLTMVFPQWFYLSPAADTIQVDIRQDALALLRSHDVRILPVLSNYLDTDWNSAAVRRILGSKAHRENLIASILRALGEYRFAGINIDFEEVGRNPQEELVVFQRELYTALRARGYLVTQDVVPLNSDYDLPRLALANDYLVVMAYDMHFSTSDPGPVAAQRWVEGILERVCAKVDPSRILVGLAGYGYDWPEGDEAEDITYQEALVRARENDAALRFDDPSCNLTFAYVDDNNVRHTVWFTDAATTFDAMRAACDMETAGVALWRLGSEDARMWRFYDRTLSTDSLSLSPFDADTLSTSAPSTEVDFEGEGEILDIVAAPQQGRVRIVYNARDQTIDDEEYQDLPSSFVIQKYGSMARTVVLTFDDGPSSRYTPAILDILHREGVPATFFVIGENAESNLAILREEYDDGYEIGDHTWSHPNLADVSQDRVRFELNSTRRLIESATGHTTVLFRAPYNADSEPETMEEILPIEEAKAQHFYTVGESIDPEDWEEGVSPDTILARVIAQQSLGSILLLHDAGGDRSATVAALPRIIDYFRQKGYTFTTIASLIGKTRNDVMPALSDSRDVMLSRMNWLIAEAIYWAEQLVFALFLAAIVFAVGRLLATAALAYIHWRRNPGRARGRTGDAVHVSVLVPAYNEEVNAVRTVQKILESTYANVDVVFVDDGSKDSTYRRVSSAFAGDPRVLVVSKPNGGKASALNEGLRRASGEVVVCIDADTQLDGRAISAMIAYFDDPSVGAVAGNVRVGNERNMLTRWQSLEYIMNQNFDRRAFDVLNCITVVPGAIGAFRRSAVEKVGGFLSDTLAEDADITVRLLRAGYAVRYCETAIAHTEAPETVRMFLRQRFRWSFGIMQTVWKHRDALLSTKFGNLGRIALPYTLVYQYMYPLVSPVADLVMVLAILYGQWEEMLAYYAAFLALDALGGALALMFERERLGRLWMLLPQRFVYRQLMYWVLVKSVLTAIKGRLVGWGLLHRTGTVKVASAQG